MMVASTGLFKQWDGYDNWNIWGLFMCYLFDDLSINEIAVCSIAVTIIRLAPAPV